MSDHTPLRWEVRRWGTDSDEWPERRLSIGPAGVAVAISPRYATPETEADFALIVHRVNTYNDLLEALSELLQVFTDLPAHRNYGDLVQKCRQAKSKAEVSE